MKRYLEVTVFVSPAIGGAYTVRIESIEGGVAEYPLVLPFGSRDLEGVVTISGNDSDRGQALASGRRAGAGAARDFGAEMFEALFKGNGLEVLAATISRARSKTDDGVDTGVRLRMSMNLHDGAMMEVARLPWELISRRDDDPLAVSDKTPLVRSFDVLLPTELRPFGGTLRILVVMSNPKGTPHLDLEAERRRIEQSWKTLNVKADFVRPVRAEFRRVLAGADYHVVHFMGHGDFDADKGGVLLMERDDAERTPDPVSGKEFAVMIADEPLRLVYLNACKTGMAGLHPFAGVASALIKKGVPAVVAMQFPISDRAAIDFATTFYERVAQNIGVEAAVTQARRALYTDGHPEWVTPVLYLRSRDGQLFTQVEAAVTVSAAAAPVDPWGEGAVDAARVFLASPCEKLKPLARTLARDLRAAGLRVVDTVPPPYPSGEHAAAVRALVARADLCVHLMGDTAGESLEDAGALRTYPIEQLRIGLENARSQLVVIPDVDLATIDEGDYKQYLASLAARSYDAGRFELVRTSRLEIKAAVLANLQRQKDARPVSGDRVKAAFVDAHDLDLEIANELVNALSDRDVEAFMQSSSDEVFEQFGEFLRTYPLYILVTGKADAAWVKEREKNARSLAVSARVPILISKYESGDAAAISLSRLKLVMALKRPPPMPIESLFRPAAGKA